MSDPLQPLLPSVNGGRVLDVATGAGDFLDYLKTNLKDGVEWIGIDSSPRAVEAATQKFGAKGMRFMEMSGDGLAFPDASFDTVAISNSIHHIEKPSAVLAEMVRVLRPGGGFIFSEMFDGEMSDPQKTHVLLHHWWADVDMARGVYHRHTYTRDQLEEMLKYQPIDIQHWLDWDESDGDAFEPEMLKWIEDIIARYLGLCAGLPGEEELCRQGVELRERLRKTGFLGALTLAVVGRKTG